MTRRQALDFLLDDMHDLGALDLVGAAFGRFRAGLCLQRLQQVIVVAVAVGAQAGKQRDPGVAHLLAAEPVVDGVLQDALEQRRQLGGAFVAVLLGQLDHGVLDNVQRGVVVADRKYGLLEGAALDAGKKIGQFLVGGHSGGCGSLLRDKCPVLVNVLRTTRGTFKVLRC